MTNLYDHSLVLNVGILCILPSTYSWHKYRHTESWYALKNMLYWSNVMMIVTFAITLANLYKVFPPPIFADILKTSTAYNLHITIGYFTFDRTYLDHPLYWQRGRMIFVHTVPLLTTYSLLSNLKQEGYGLHSTTTMVYSSAIGASVINFTTEALHLYLANRVRYSVSANVFTWILIWIVGTPSFIVYALTNYI